MADRNRIFNESFTAELADEVAKRVVAALARNGNGTSAGGLRTIREAARYLSLSMTTIKVMLAAGELPSVTRGARRMIAQQDLEHWISTHRS